MANKSVASHILSLERLRKDVAKLPGRQVRSASLKGAMRSFVEEFFEQVRPTIVPGPACEDLEQEMRVLLELCHKQPSIDKTKDLLRRVKKGLIRLDTAQIGPPDAGDSGGIRDNRDEQILVTLRSLLPTAAMSYEQALLDLGLEARLSWRGPATDLRESLRETLDHLAPDKDVEQSPGFKLVKDTSGPTMRQKVRYILGNRGVGKSTASPTETATDAVEEAVGQFVRSVYTRSSVSTHTPTEKHEVVRVLEFVRIVLCELLEVRS